MELVPLLECLKQHPFTTNEKAVESEGRGHLLLLRGIRGLGVGAIPIAQRACRLAVAQGLEATVGAARLGALLLLAPHLGDALLRRLQRGSLVRSVRGRDPRCLRKWEDVGGDVTTSGGMITCTVEDAAQKCLTQLRRSSRYGLMGSSGDSEPCLPWQHRFCCWARAWQRSASASSPRPPRCCGRAARSRAGRTHSTLQAGSADGPLPAQSATHELTTQSTVHFSLCRRHLPGLSHGACQE